MKLKKWVLSIFPLWRGVLIVVAVLALIVRKEPLAICAKEPFVPHLIQTVSEKDIFEGMLALGFLEVPVLEAEDCEAAYKNVKECIVQIHMKNAYGSGVVWELTPAQVIIVTNKHVLEYWDSATDYVRFPQGYSAGAELLGISGEYDVGFLCIDCIEFDYSELEQLRYAHKDAEIYQSLQTGDNILCVGAEAVVLAESTPDFYQGSIGDTWRYIEDFGEYMLYGYGYAREGMSGGGTFDAKGNLIGILSGATMEGETASVPIPLILEAYGEIQGMQEIQ